LIEIVNKIIWTSVVSLVIIILGGITLYLQPDKFEIVLSDGTIKAKYYSGVLRIYSGRYLAFKDEVRPYYWNGKGYIIMYKSSKCGFKYSNLSYSKDGDTTYVKQDICYVKGIQTRYFEITENKIKSSFEFKPFDNSTKTYFKWNFNSLDSIETKEVYLDKTNKESRAVMDFDIINDWEKEIENTVRVERFANGKLTIRTRIFKGYAFYDPEIILKEEENVTYTRSTETRCKDGVCSLVLYSGTRFVEEDNKWKRVENAKSLKDVWDVVYLENDTFHKIDIIDYNLSSITFDLSYDENSVNFSEYEHEIEEGKLKTKFKVIEILYDNVTEEFYENEIEYEVEVEESNKESFVYSGNPLDKKFKFGVSSITIKLQEPNTENLDDTWTNSGSTSSNFGSSLTLSFLGGAATSQRKLFITFNISSIPSSVNIIDSNLSLYMYQEGIDSGESYNSTACFYNTSWTELGLTWASTDDSKLILCGESYFLVEGPDPTPDAPNWINYAVTNIVNSSYNAGNINVSIVINATLISGDPLSFDDIDSRSKEYSADVTLRPFLNITYSEAPVAGPSLNCTIPNDWSATHVINLSKPCNLNISGYVGTMHFVGSGYWNLTTNISVSHFCFAKNVTRGNITWMGNSSARLNINGTC